MSKEFRLVFVLTVVSVLYAGLVSSEEIELPPLWGIKQGSTKEVDGAYHMLVEVQLVDSQKSFIFEEWALGPGQVFRLDFTESSTGRRQTILNDEKRKERFLFEPFKCSLSPASSPFEKNLASKFPPVKSFIQYGIGSLWLYGMEKKATYITSDKTVFHDGKKQSTMVPYDSFRLEASDEYPFQIDYFFLQSSLDEGAKPNFDLLMAIHVSSVDNGQVNNRMRARLINFESGDKATIAIKSQKDIFTLPTGYGCSRADRPGHEYKLPPVDLLTDKARIIELDMISHVPLSLEHDLDKWRTYSGYIRLLSGQLKIDAALRREVYIVQKHERSRSLMLNETKKSTTLVTKRIWDLGETLIGGTADLSVPARYYVINELSGRCLNYGKAKLTETANIEIPIMLPGNNQDKHVLAGLTLDPLMMKELFIRTDGFHLIRVLDGELTRSVDKYVYERRDEQFTLRNSMGASIWTGPVSIVREYYDPNAQSKMRISLEQRMIRVEIILLSKNKDQVLAKIQLGLLSIMTIDEAQLHRELDVSPCFEFDSHSSQTSNFEVVYPVESVAISKALSSDGMMRETIYQHFLMSMVLASDLKLDLLQIHDVKVVFDSGSVAVKAKLSQKPHLLAYDCQENQHFSPYQTNSLFIEYKPNEAMCGETCYHYNCVAFSYCKSTMQCSIQLRESPDSYRPMTYESEPGCKVFKRPALEKGSVISLSPNQFLQQLNEKILARVDGYLNIGLECVVDNLGGSSQLERVTLVPSTLDVKTNNDQHSEERATNLEYSVVFFNDKFVTPKKRDDKFPIDLAEHLGYVDCERLCGELDCRSFSHCRLEKTCVISQLHEASAIKSMIEPAEYCNVFSLDYLSKFMRSAKVDEKMAFKKTGKSLRLDTDRDCAMQCMDEDDFKCRSFYYCPETSTCYLQKGRLYAHLNHSQVLEVDGTVGCHLFTRSYFAEFDFYYGKKLAQVDKSEIAVHKVGGEDCAAMCGELMGECRAFHLCQSGSMREPLCGLLIGEPNSEVPKESLISADECSSFIVSNKSPLFGPATPLDYSDDSYDVDTQKESAKKEVAGKSIGDSLATWMMRLVFLIAGVLLGYFLALRRSQLT